MTNLRIIPVVVHLQTRIGNRYLEGLPPGSQIPEYLRRQNARVMLEYMNSLRAPMAHRVIKSWAN